MTYQPQHEITVSPYPFEGGAHPFIFGADCSCKQWTWMPNAFEKTAAAMQEHYVAFDMAVRKS